MNGSGKMSRKFCRYVICVSNMGNLQNSSLKACLGHFVSLKNLFCYLTSRQVKKWDQKTPVRVSGYQLYIFIPGTPRPTIYFHGCLLISKHFLYTYLVHHPTETSIYTWLALGFQVDGSPFRGFLTKKWVGFPNMDGEKNGKKTLFFLMDDLGGIYTPILGNTHIHRWITIPFINLNTFKKCPLPLPYRFGPTRISSSILGCFRSRRLRSEEVP